MSKTLAIIGAGELGRQIARLALTDNYCSNVVFFDDFNAGHTPEGHSIWGGAGQVEEQYGNGLFDELMIGIGYNYMPAREKFYNLFSGKIPFATIVHSSVYRDSLSKIGEGAVIYPRCCIDAGVTIGANVLMNLSCTIAHDSHIGAHSFLAPGVVLSGFVNVGAQCMLGVGTTVIDSVSIAPGIRTGGATTIIKDLTEPGLYVGSPARFIRTN